MADRPTLFFLQEITTRIGPIALVTMDNGEDWQKPNVFGRARSLRSTSCLPRLARSDGWRGLVLTGKPFVFAAGADLTEFPQHDDARARTRRRAGRVTTRSRQSATCPSRRSPPSTAPRSAAASRSRSTATSARSPARCATSASRRSSSGSSRAGAARSSPRALVGAAKAVELIVANPLKQNRLLRAARRSSSGLPTRCSTTSSSSTTRSSGSCARSRRSGRRARTPISRTRPRSARRHGTPSTTPSTASRSRRIAHST